MLIQADFENVVRELTKELNTICSCSFKDKKKNLEKLKEVLDKRWDEPIDCNYE